MVADGISRGAVVGVLAGCLGWMPSRAVAVVAGEPAIGTTNYPNGGLRFVNPLDLSGDLSVNTTGGGIYSFAVDSTTQQALSGSIGSVTSLNGLGDGSHSVSLLTKLQLHADGTVPTIVGHTTSYHDNSAAFGSVSGSTSMVIDTGSGAANLADHYAYIGTNNGKVMKVQLNPPDAGHPNGDAGAAPKVVAVFSLVGGATIAAAIDQTYAYFTPLNSTTITRIKLSDNSLSTITGLPSATYYKSQLLNNTLYYQTLGSSTVVVNLANVSNGVIQSYSTIPTAPASPGTFAVDPTQPYVYTGAMNTTNAIPNPSQTTFTIANATFTKTNLLTGQTAGSPLPFSLPSIIPANQSDHTGLSLTAIDPDSHAILVGTDNNLPGNVSKFGSGGNADVSPIFQGAIQMPLDASTYNPPNNNFPYRTGDVNMRGMGIDPKGGYAYWATDTNVPHVLTVQYSQKGSIKGEKISLPASATLQDVNFFSSVAAPPTASSSGKVRLALYNDAGGAPGSLLWQSGDIADNVPAGGGWLSVSSGLPTITAAGNYWLAWQVDSTLDVPSYIAVPGNGFTFNQAYGAFPASLSGSTATSDQWSMYVDYIAPKPGDADRNGRIDADDYFLIDRGYSERLSGWGNGDFNGDGVINGDDYFIIDTAFASQGQAPALVSAAPEPGGLSVLFASSCLLLRRHSRRG